MPPPILQHDRITAGDADPARWLLILHGIYGSGRNWATIGRRLVEERPEWGVLLVDLRLHGGSVGFAPPHTLEAAANDVADLIEELGLPVSVLLGHSYGGKVALAYARAHPRGLDQVWVVDSTLRVSEPTGSAWRLTEAVRALPEQFSSREELAERLAPHGYSASLANWLAMNLERDGELLRWKLDWDGVEEMLRDYFRTDLWEVIEQPPAGTEVHVIRAIDSDSLNDADVERIGRAEARHGAVHLHALEGGHWINVENPEGVVQLLSETFPTTDA